MKSGVPFLSIDIMCMIYLDVKCFSVVCLSIYCEKPATLTTMGHFFEKKINYCPPDIICNSVALKCQCVKHTEKIFNSCFLYIQQVVARNTFT